MKKITIASGEKIRQLQSEVDELMFAIAEYMIEPGEDQQEWTNSVLVTDESWLGDFLWFESDVQKLSTKLQLPPLQRRDPIFAIAELLHQRKNPH